MKLFVTILEPTVDAALDAIRAIEADHDGIEVRAERFKDLDLHMLRRATSKPMLLTYRGRAVSGRAIESAIAAGFDLVDVEYAPHMEREAIERHRDRIVLSHHDYERVPDLERLLRDMLELRCAHTKIAATPADFAGNERLLAAVQPGISIIGMGERGLYARILAPFRGSEMAFVSTLEERSAAPGQITLQRALEIYGERREGLQATEVFAVLGDPAGHSLSPSIHNALFREKGVPAAYTIASFESFAEIERAFLAGEPRGLSITAPFKLDAFAFAERTRATIGENAVACGAVNTLVNLVNGKGIVADNTDVDGFETLLRDVCGRDRKSVGLVGAGGTARAALVALRRAGMHVTVFNRTASRLAPAVEPLESLQRFDGEVIVNTLPPGATPPIHGRAGMSLIDAAYGSDDVAARHDTLRAAGVHVLDGLDLLRAQAVRQHQLFMRVFDDR